MLQKIKELISKKESLTLEFKESKTKLNKDLYDTVLKPLIEKGLLELTIPDKSKSPNQKYEKRQ